MKTIPMAHHSKSLKNEQSARPHTGQTENICELALSFSAPGGGVRALRDLAPSRSRLP
jgi:hypothetical protein